MSECNSIECISVEVSNLDNQLFRINKINEIKDYFIAILLLFSFDYFDKFFIVLSPTSRSISIASFATVIGTTIAIASASLSLTFSLSAGLVKKY